MKLTLNSSLRQTELLSPAQNWVHTEAFHCKEDGTARAVQGLQYLAKPIDHLIQAAALPIFTVLDHISDIKKDFTKDSSGKRKIVQGVAKVLLTPATLLAKEGVALTVSAAYGLSAVVKLLLPISTLFAVCRGKDAASRYFFNHRCLEQRADAAGDAYVYKTGIDPNNQYLAQYKRLKP